MTGKDVYEIWAPVKAKWVDWVRPVPFALINVEFKSYEIGDFIIPTIDYIQSNTHLVFAKVIFSRASFEDSQASFCTSPTCACS